MRNTDSIIVKKMTRDELLEKLNIDNGEGYLPNDNRTYSDTPLSSIPSQDIEKRISLSKEGSSVIHTPFGSFLGKSSVEISQKSTSLILHYPKATNVNMIFIKSFIGATLYPVSLINRYNLKDFCLKHKINIYYSSKSEKFYAFFDERFLNDNPISFIMNEIPKEIYTVIKSNDKKEHLAICSKSIDDIKSFFNLNNEYFKKIIQNYQDSRINFSSGKKVIVIRYEINSNIDREALVSKNQYSNLSSLIFTQNLNFSFFKALKINDNLFPLDKNDNVDIKNLINICKKNIFSDDSVIIYNDYTDEDWLFINNIYSRYKELNDSIYKFFKSCKKDDESFKQLSNNDSSLIKLLTK